MCCSTYKQRSEGNLKELLFFFYHMELVACKQIIMLGSKGFHINVIKSKLYLECNQEGSNEYVRIKTCVRNILHSSTAN